MFKVNGGQFGTPNPAGARSYNVMTDPSQGLAAAQNNTLNIAQYGRNPGGYTPAMASSTGYKANTISGPAAIQAGQVAQTDLNPYMNPYTDQVINQSLMDLNRAGQMQINNIGASAEAAGAFGGSRHGIAEAETNRALQEQMARTAAGLRSDSFNNAQGMAQFDIGTALQADTTTAGNQLAASMANQQAKNAAAQYAAQAANNTSQYNAGARNTAGQFNSNLGLQGANLGLAANQQLANIANQGFNMGRTINSDLAADGAREQAMMQALIDATRGQYGGFTGAPANSLAMLSGALSSVPSPESTKETQNPGLFGVLGSLPSLFGG